MGDPPKEPAKDLKDNLSSLLSGKDGWMKIGIVLVVLSGGTNILATKEGTSATAGEITQALKEIHDLHEQLSVSMDRQKEILTTVKDIMAAKASPSPK